MATTNPPTHQGVCERTIRLENRTNGHNKYYEIKLWHDLSVSQWHLSTHYGKIGTDGSTLQWPFKDKGSWRIEMELRKIRDSKIAKGYLEVTTPSSPSKEVKVVEKKKPIEFSRFSGFFEE